MHWLPHEYALPSPGKDKRWCLLSDAADRLPDHPVELPDQKRIKVAERSITVLVSVKEKKKTKRRPKTKKSMEKGREQEKS